MILYFLIIFSLHVFDIYLLVWSIGLYLDSIYAIVQVNKDFPKLLQGTFYKFNPYKISPLRV